MTEPSYQYGSSDVHEHADVRFIDLYVSFNRKIGSLLLLRAADDTAAWCTPILTCLFWSQSISSNTWGSRWHSYMTYPLYLPVYSDYSDSPLLLTWAADDTTTWCTLTVACLFWSVSPLQSKHICTPDTSLSILIIVAAYHCLRQQTQLHDVLLILYLPVFSDHSGYCTCLSILMTVALHHCFRQ